MEILVERLVGGSHHGIKIERLGFPFDRDAIDKLQRKLIAHQGGGGFANQQIAAVLLRLSRYRWVFVTEHYPPDNDAIRPNVDKV